MSTRNDASGSPRQNKRSNAVQNSSDSEVTVSQETTVPAAEAPPDGGYGWVCTAAAALINMHSWGFSSAYAVFLANYLDTDLFPGATSLQYAFIGGLSLTCLFLVSPIAAILVGKFGIKTPMLAGMLLETASLICASFATQIWHLFLTQGVLFGFGLGLLFIPTAAVIPQWFTTKRSLASGVSLAGAAFGGTVYSLAAGAMIRNLGIHWALRILGILAFGVNTTMIFLIRDLSKPSGVVRSPFKITPFRYGGFWLLLGFGFFTMLGYFILIFTLANFANYLKLSSSQAAIVSAMFNLGQTIGRPLVGYFSDRFGRINIAASITFIAGVIPLAMWVNTYTYAQLVAFATLEGIVGGTFWAAIAPLMIEVVGMADVSYGLTPMWLSLAVPCTFSEAIALSIVEGSRSYLGTQLFVGLTYIAAAVCVFFLRGWKLNDHALIAANNDEPPVQGTNPHSVEEKHEGKSRASVRLFLKMIMLSFHVAKV